MSADTDVLIIGGGVAGLAAAGELTRAGARVTLLEARERLGGRIWTAHDGLVPVELGAEFIHGKARRVLDVIEAAGIPYEELQGQPFCSRRGQLGPCSFFEETDKILEKLDPPSAQDESFADFLRRCCSGESDAKRWATQFVEGFHAADANLISVHSLVRGEKADQEIEGDRSFRVVGGYGRLVELLQAASDPSLAAIELKTVVRRVTWSAGRVEVHAQRWHDERLSEWRARAALVTLPLGVLQDADGVHFDPPLAVKKAAMARLQMGTARRITLQFAERFWDALSAGGASLSEMGFLFTDDELMPTWWTLLPNRVPVLTGWAAGPRAERLGTIDQAELAARAVDAIARLLGVPGDRVQGLVEQTWTHNWQTDPFARGAYSYVRVGGEGAQEVLAEPVEQTLFFAGEATDYTGHHSTVHGAIASGIRAARELLAR